MFGHPIINDSSPTHELVRGKGKGFNSNSIMGHMHSDEVHDFSFHMNTKPLDIFTLTRIAPPLLPLPSACLPVGREREEG
jgi:hypothetical protein